MYLTQSTQHQDELYTRTIRKLSNKHQVHFDYYGELDRNEDEADCYTPIKAVAIA